jgi:hypothetical protein
MAWKLRGNRLFCGLFCGSGSVALFATFVFLLNRQEDVRTLAIWLSGFELVFGIVVIVLAWGLHRESAAGVGHQEPAVVGVSA